RARSAWQRLADRGFQNLSGDGPARHERAPSGGVEHQRVRLPDEPERVSDGPGRVEHARVGPPVLFDERSGMPDLVLDIDADELDLTLVGVGHGGELRAFLPAGTAP